MGNPAATRSYLQAEVEALAPFELVAVAPAGKPLQQVEVTRREDAQLEVRVAGRPAGPPPLPVPVQSKLRERGFTSADAADAGQPWLQPAPDAASAVALVYRVLAEVFSERADATLDVFHGSHRAEHEARERLAAVRKRVEAVLSALGSARLEQDADGDYLVSRGEVRVVVAPRVPPGGPAVVRVFAITNVGMPASPELGLFLARLNFGLMFGRFALDAEHQAIWFDETLLGDEFRDAELRFTIDVVARTADQWDDRLKQMFGGVTYQSVLASGGGQQPPSAKPGQGGYA